MQSDQIRDSATRFRAADVLARCREHVIARVEAAPVGTQPFHHSFIEKIFPDDIYRSIRAHMVACKHHRQHQDRHQDNPAFMNKRFNLFHDMDEVTQCIRAVFSDSDVKLALLRKFYIDPTSGLSDALAIHEEFEYFFTKAGRFQNIHIDIPPKFMSFVFYIPEDATDPQMEEKNATILYDKSLNPHYPARFRANSVCIFVPHFYTYHGFSSTIDRDVLVMFYINGAELLKWQSMRQENRDTPPYTGLLDAVENKLRAHPLVEFGLDEQRLLAERATCRVNAPQGRVMI